MPHIPTQPQVYLATPLVDGKPIEDAGQEYLITPIQERVCAGKIKSLLIGAAVGFFLGVLTVGLRSRCGSD
jgi:hypothetical protein